VVRRFSVTLFAAAILASFSGAARVDARRAPGTGLAHIAYGRPAPDFAFDRTSVPASLAALRGRPIVVNFWAAYCAPCLDELDVFARLKDRYGPDVAFVAVSDQGHEITDEDLREKGIDAISVADPDRKIFGLYGVEPIPVTLVLAPDETVRYVSVGELDWDELQGAVDAVRPLASPAAVASPAT
jgi:cytochrome c biogenesis protein CcmG/thiol:disulfide interchange protein DsbE